MSLTVSDTSPSASAASSSNDRVAEAVGVLDRVRARLVRRELDLPGLLRAGPGLLEPAREHAPRVAERGGSVGQLEPHPVRRERPVLSASSATSSLAAALAEQRARSRGRRADPGSCGPIHRGLRSRSSPTSSASPRHLHEPVRVEQQRRAGREGGRRPPRAGARARRRAGVERPSHRNSALPSGPTQQRRRVAGARVADLRPVRVDHGVDQRGHLVALAAAARRRSSRATTAPGERPSRA